MLFLFLIGIAACGLGVFMLLASRKDPAGHERRTSIKIGVVLLLIGIPMLLGLLAQHIIGKGAEVSVGIPIILNGLALIWAVGADIYATITCTEKVRAKCVKVKVSHHSNGVGSYRYDSYTPELTYNWMGQVYTIDTGMIYAKRKAAHYVPGRQYDIYVNPKKPRIARVYRKIEWIDFVMLPLGIFLILVGVSIIMNMRM